MKTLEISFWIMLGITFYAYVGYGILLYVLVKIKNLFLKKPNFSNQVLPEVTLLVAAYNESDYVVDKVKNTIAQSYPSDKLKIVFVTDGTTDDSIEKLKSFEQVKVYHSDERKGKNGCYQPSNAIN